MSPGRRHGDRSWERIRPLALGVVGRDDTLLVVEVEDPASGEVCYRPPGGAIEFGETSAEALVREFEEELGAELTSLNLVGVIENSFTFDGRQGHETVFAYEGDLVDDALYRADTIRGEEHDGSTFEAQWLPLDEFDADGRTLVPAGLFELLTEVDPEPEGVHLID